MYVKNHATIRKEVSICKKKVYIFSKNVCGMKRNICLIINVMSYPKNSMYHKNMYFENKVIVNKKKRKSPCIKKVMIVCHKVMFMYERCSYKCSCILKIIHDW